MRRSRPNRVARRDVEDAQRLVLELRVGALGQAVEDARDPSGIRLGDLDLAGAGSAVPVANSRVSDDRRRSVVARWRLDCSSGRAERRTPTTQYAMSASSSSTEAATNSRDVAMVADSRSSGSGRRDRSVAGASPRSELLHDQSAVLMYRSRFESLVRTRPTEPKLRRLRRATHRRSAAKRSSCGPLRGRR